MAPDESVSFTQVVSAFELLKNSQQRKEYDEKLKLNDFITKYDLYLENYIFNYMTMFNKKFFLEKALRQFYSSQKNL